MTAYTPDGAVLLPFRACRPAESVDPGSGVRHEPSRRRAAQAAAEQLDGPGLRTGKRDNPTKRRLEALAQFFQVPPAYFFDDEQSAKLDEEIALPGALREAGVRSIALRTVNLSVDGQAVISDMVEAIARREKPGAGPDS
ncbi:MULTISPECIES: hypothetical protein [unclassified Streptomyces]|uniref:hypothetical protein n=1 Tax=unclassified Streptomyces TaxID=2593676 RepID=UPI00192946DC|nr:MULTISPECIES: hypothetical protein [unclassified Streptomyces]